ncbi:hypothetical protein DBT_0930 [Dissulfuribacter thermophilus]|uniref:Putative regulatory protein FmdB zinc ribbon domain-containing protein n=1 Tax=Dissulfuribacter thermophilus TaxID=1156395 RepID=A0A1B9F6L8_9BACT|nr:zinc ribbon domain-containing protein [Dissulfuribacter thermophilus]OCC15579.1 hypothetical protein DBT_0930 [Dissulfuribacter thermophilus]
MPIYEFVCNNCKKTFEKFVMSHRDIREISCPKCGSNEVQKLLSNFSCGCGSSSFGTLGAGCGNTSSTRFG